MIRNHVQIVAVMPGGGFESLGLVPLDSISNVLNCLSTLDTRNGRCVNPLHIMQTYEAKRAALGNNDHQDDAA